jgi:hypothetical protein
VNDQSSMPAQAPVAGPDAAWISAQHRAAPAEALSRIQTICAGFPDLFGAMLAVLATHQGVPREKLAHAIRQFRPDTQAYTADDVLGLLVAIWNGGRQGFDSVLRTRRGTPRTAHGFPWASD